jgi:hypothetical protein
MWDKNSGQDSQFYGLDFGANQIWCNVDSFFNVGKNARGDSLDIAGNTYIQGNLQMTKDIKLPSNASRIIDFNNTAILTPNYKAGTLDIGDTNGEWASLKLNLPLDANGWNITKADRIEANSFKPTNQPASDNQQPISDTANGIMAGPVYSQSDMAAVKSLLSSLLTLTNQLRDDLTQIGLIKGSA